MQTQIHAESWMVLLGITPLKPSLSAPNPKVARIKNSMPPAQTSTKNNLYVWATDEQKKVLAQEVRLILAIEDKSTKAVLEEIISKQESGDVALIPFNDRGQKMSDFAIRNIVNQVKREIRAANPDRQYKHIKVVNMTNDGLSIEEIIADLNVSSEYVRYVLLRAGMIKRKRFMKPKIIGV